MRRRDAFSIGLAAAAVLSLRRACGTPRALATTSTDRQNQQLPDNPTPRQHRVGAGDQDAHVLQPLDGETLRQRALDIFPTGYQTTISIIQGVSLSAVVMTTVTASTASNAMPVGILSRATITFAAIVVVSYSYIWFTTIMRWPMTFRDILVPYTLGAAEIILALQVADESRWWTSFAILAAVGALAYANTLTRLTANTFRNPNRDGSHDPNRIVKSLLWSLIGLTGAALAVILLFGWLVGEDDASTVELSGLIIVAAIFITMIWLSELRLNELFWKTYKIPRTIPILARSNLRNH